MGLTAGLAVAVVIVVAAVTSRGPGSTSADVSPSPSPSVDAGATPPPEPSPSLDSTVSTPTPEANETPEPSPEPSPSGQPSGDATSGTETPPAATEPPTPATTEPRSLPTEPPPAGGTTAGSGTTTATGLDAAVGCDDVDPLRPVVTLQWAPADTRGGEQRVAITTRPDGFETGAYVVTEGLPADRSAFMIWDVQAGGIYYWRVLTSYDRGWVHGDTVTFTGPTCVADEPG